MKRFTAKQIIGFLREAEAGLPNKELCLRHGLAKNTAQLMTLFALSNLWMARRHLLANAGEVRLQNAETRAGPGFLDELSGRGRSGSALNPIRPDRR